ncbi:YggT family protein [Euhalothece natronophila Z-M001]|uniref:YggT family protein n=1 Tax=Euhalothece natronophila Z-M001 TaxID=522448 RepID=A0A5B8NP49_9CHRO|nr:YggT family protein [Euhalothece natronophila]QDZ41063.1 YggT family protein [Euhalothece natronophila Z-M001]
MTTGANFITNVLVNTIQIYLLLLFVRILLSWFQTAGWAQQAMSYLSPITDPYLNIFRSFIPPLGGIDLSPILAIFSLQIIASLLGSF